MDEIDRALEAMDVPTATTARPVVESLLGIGDTRVPLTTLTQSDVQHFLWRVLPTRWLTEDREHHEIAWALGDFLATAGLDRYAGICRDPRTHAILSAWHASPEKGAAAALAADRESGLVPPETDALVFGEVMGGDEARVYADVTRLLERSIRDGALDPSARGFPARSRRLVEAHLRAPGLEFDGRSPVAVVREERLGLWVDKLAQGHRGPWTSMVPGAVAPAPPPEGVELSLSPAVAVLEGVGEGVTLTGAGYLPAKLAVDLDDRFRWSEQMMGARPRGESDLPPLVSLDEHLRDKRLLTRRAKRLTLSAEGRRCLAEPARLWSVLTALAPGQKGFEADALAVVAAVLLTSEGLTHDELDSEVAGVLAGKWHAADGKPVHPDDVYGISADWYRRGLPLGWWEEGHRGRYRLELTPVGEAAAINLFRSVATQPMSR